MAAAQGPVTPQRPLLAAPTGGCSAQTTPCPCEAERWEPEPSPVRSASPWRAWFSSSACWGLRGARWGRGCMMGAVSPQRTESCCCRPSCAALRCAAPSRGERAARDPAAPAPLRPQRRPRDAAGRCAPSDPINRGGSGRLGTAPRWARHHGDLEQPRRLRRAERERGARRRRGSHRPRAGGRWGGAGLRRGRGCAGGAGPGAP